MSNGKYLDQWKDEVFRRPGVSDTVKVFLLFLAHHFMDPEGNVSEKREDLAEKLGCHIRKVSAKFEAAISAGLLEQTARGQKHQNSAYRAIIGTPPQGARVRHPEAIAQGADCRHPENSQGAADYHPENSAQGAGTRHPEEAQGADSRHPEKPPLYKDRAHAHSRDHLSPPTQQPEVDDHAAGGVVVPLFEEQMITGKKLSSAKRGLPEPRPPVTREDFDKFWATYPRRIAKGAARKAWDKALKNGADPEEVILGARAYASLPRDPADGLKFVAHPATWLNAERWTDEADPEPAAPISTTTSRVAQVDDALAEFHRLTGTDAHPNTIQGEVVR